MIRYAEGNLLEADVDALVNTVNTVGVMGKGIALMFREAFADNARAYEAACRRGEVRIGSMFVTEPHTLVGPRWIVNFPTKKHWRKPSNLAWIETGLRDLTRVIADLGIRSIAVPPLGAGNGGLDWDSVRTLIERSLGPLSSVDVVVFAPSATYRNVSKRAGVEALTPPRALVAELVRRYGILGLDCSILEAQKLAYFLGRSSVALMTELDLRFETNRYGPYSHRLNHLLDRMDGSYLHSDKRIADAGPFDVIRFDDTRRDAISAYLNADGAEPYRRSLATVSRLVDGFESPFGLELLATVDWLLREGRPARVEAVRDGMAGWNGDQPAADRKLALFDARAIGLALDRLAAEPLGTERAA